MDERMKQMAEHRAMVEEKITEELTNGKNVLITSLPGMGKLASAKAAATKAGLRVFELDLATDLSFGGLPVPVQKTTETNLQKKEAFILDSVERAKANAILVSTSPKEDITAIVNVANKLNIPLIVATTHKNSHQDKLHVSFFDKPQEIKALLDADAQDLNPKIPMPSQAVLSRMRVSFAADLDQSNKPKPK